MQVKKLSEAIEEHKPKILIYGSSGAGKTTLIGTLPGKVLILSAEAGLLPLRRMSDMSRFDVVEIKSVEDLVESYKAVSAGDSGYDWVALDSVSEITEIMLLSELKKALDPRQAYGEVIARANKLVRAWRDLQCVGTVFLVKEQKEKLESGKMFASCQLPGQKLGQAIPYFFDEVFRVTVIETVSPDGSVSRRRALQCDSSSEAEAKDRSGKLSFWEPAHLGKIINKIQGVTSETA